MMSWHKSVLCRRVSVILGTVRRERLSLSIGSLLWAGGNSSLLELGSVDKISFMYFLWDLFLSV